MTDPKNMTRKEILKLAVSTIRMVSKSLRNKNNRAESRAKFHLLEAAEILRKESFKNA